MDLQSIVEITAMGNDLVPIAVCIPNKEWWCWLEWRVNKFFAITGQLVYDFTLHYLDVTISKPTKNTLPAGAQ